jgi:hypothetical protein
VRNPFSRKRAGEQPDPRPEPAPAPAAASFGDALPEGVVRDPLAGGTGATGQAEVEAAGFAALAGLIGSTRADAIRQAQAEYEPTIDMRNDPELRRKLEEVLGRELTPGTSERIDTADDPELAMKIMQVVQQHALEKATGSARLNPPGS